MAEVWFVDLDDEERRSRLTERHIVFGKDRLEAARWVVAVDEANARRIEPGRADADLIIDMAAFELASDPEPPTSGH